jgi:hypothetical protein
MYCSKKCRPCMNVRTNEFLSPFIRQRLLPRAYSTPPTLINPLAALQLRLWYPLLCIQIGIQLLVHCIDQKLGVPGKLIVRSPGDARGFDTRCFRNVGRYARGYSLRGRQGCGHHCRLRVVVDEVRDAVWKIDACRDSAYILTNKVSVIQPCRAVQRSIWQMNH